MTRQQRHKSPAARLKRALAERFDAILDAPLPKRWANLVHALNERARQQTERRQRDDPRNRP
jgi:hypothetical protein